MITKSKSNVSTRAGKTVGTVKRSVTISAVVDERARLLVGHRGYSALVNEALSEKLQYAATKRLVAEYEAEHGEIPEIERKRARRKLRDAGLI